MISVRGDSLEFPPVIVTEPRSSMVPLVFDSPHSGSLYPAEFNTLVSHKRMRRAEDAFVDELASREEANRLADAGIDNSTDT